LPTLTRNRYQKLRSRNRDPKRLPGGPDVRKQSHEATVRAYAEAPSLVLVRCISPLRPESSAFGLAGDSAVIGPKARSTRQAGPACTLATTVCVASIGAEVDGVTGRHGLPVGFEGLTIATPPLASHATAIGRMRQQSRIKPDKCFDRPMKVKGSVQKFFAVDWVGGRLRRGVDRLM
jgi:hypothetical protein